MEGLGLSEALVAALLGGAWVSGDEFGNMHGVTRAAVSKHVAELRRLGFEIASSPRRGYRLVKAPDLLLPCLVRPLLGGRFGCVFKHMRRTGSTNDDAAMLAREGAPEGAIVVAEEQTAGRGRMKRSWHSPACENIYVSVVLRPAVPLEELPPLTLTAGVALHDTLREEGFDVEIKWPNDVLLAKKKVAGVLTEMHAEPERLVFVILGIGLNVNTIEFPEELRTRATSLRLSLPPPHPKLARHLLLARLLGHLEQHYDLFLREGPTAVVSAFRERFTGYGRTVKVMRGEKTLCGVVEDIGDDGALLLRQGEEVERVLSGEIVMWE